MDNNLQKNKLLKAFYNAIPLKDDTRIDHDEDWERYIPGLHDNAGSNPIDELAQAIRYADSAANYLFCGHRGAGKSIELKRLARQLNAEPGVIALYLDLADYIDLGAEIAVGDLLIAIMVGLTITVNKELKLPLAQSTWFETIGRFFQSEIAVDVKFEFNAYLLSAAAKLKKKPSFKKTLQELTEGQIDNVVASVDRFATYAVSRIQTEKCKPLAKVVLIVDSLELLHATESIFRSVHQTFHTNAQQLKLSMLSFVFSVPPYLPLVSPGIGALYGSGLTSLPQVKVRGKNNERHAEGIARLQSVVEKRFPSWREVLQEQQLQKLIVASGGNLRVLIQLLQKLIVKLERYLLPLNEDGPVNSALSDVRNETQLTQDEINWLKTVREKKSAVLIEDSSGREALARLFAAHLILDYRNGALWYDTLPLIDELLDSA